MGKKKFPNQTNFENFSVISVFIKKIDNTKFFAIWNRTVSLAVTVNSKCITFGWVFFKAFLAENGFR